MKNGIIGFVAGFMACVVLFGIAVLLLGGDTFDVELRRGASAPATGRESDDILVAELQRQVDLGLLPAVVRVRGRCSLAALEGTDEELPCIHVSQDFDVLVLEED